MDVCFPSWQSRDRCGEILGHQFKPWSPPRPTQLGDWAPPIGLVYNSSDKIRHENTQSRAQQPTAPVAKVTFQSVTPSTFKKEFRGLRIPNSRVFNESDRNRNKAKIQDCVQKCLKSKGIHWGPTVHFIRTRSKMVSVLGRDASCSQVWFKSILWFLCHRAVKPTNNKQDDENFLSVSLLVLWLNNAADKSYKTENNNARIKQPGTRRRYFTADRRLKVRLQSEERSLENKRFYISRLRVDDQPNDGFK